MRVTKEVQFYHPVFVQPERFYEENTQTANSFPSEKPILYLAKSRRDLSINFAYPQKSPEDAARLGQTYRTSTGKSLDLEELRERFLFLFDIRNIKEALPFWGLNKTEFEELTSSKLEGRKISPVFPEDITEYMLKHKIIYYDRFFNEFYRSDRKSLEDKALELVKPIIHSNGNLRVNMKESFEALKKSSIVSRMVFTDEHLLNFTEGLVGEYVWLNDFGRITGWDGPKRKMEVVSHFQDGVSGDSSRREKYELKTIDGKYRKDEKDIPKKPKR